MSSTVLSCEPSPLTRGTSEGDGVRVAMTVVAETGVERDGTGIKMTKFSEKLHFYVCCLACMIAVVYFLKWKVGKTYILSLGLHY